MPTASSHLPACCQLPAACSRLREQARIERQRQQIAQRVAAGFTPEVGEDHVEVAAELPQNLPAWTARWRWRVRVGDNGDACEAAVAFRQRLEHRDAFGAEGQTVGGVL